MWTTMQDQKNTRAAMKEEFQRRIEAMMGERDLETGEALAIFVGVTKNTGYGWMNGTLPSAPMLARLADAFGTNADWWLGRTEIRTPLPRTAAPAVDDETAPASKPPTPTARVPKPAQATPAPADQPHQPKRATGTRGRRSSGPGA